MKTVRVQLYGITGKYVVVNSEATAGATVGDNLKWPDGSTVTVDQLKAITSPPSSQDIGTSDDVLEGQYNLYFTGKRAQDAVGSILVDSSTINFTYDPDAHTIKADAILPPPTFVPYLVPAGTIFVVPLNAQALWTIPIELQGDAGLEIDGALVEVN